MPRDTDDCTQIARQVLAEAAEAEKFSDLNDAERLLWMIRRAVQKGMQREARSRPETLKKARRKARARTPTSG